MPFALQFDRVHLAIRKAAGDAGLTPRRADDLFEGKAVLQKILAGIEEARVVVADVTGRNPNVYYELGVTHLRKDTCILLTQHLDDVPFDLRHLDILRYDPTPAGMASLRRALKPIILRLAGEIASPTSSDIIVLYWAKSHQSAYGAGLVVENLGTETALNLEGQRLMPTGAFDSSTALKSLRPGERAGIGDGWNSAPAPDDSPAHVPDGKYQTRVTWENRAGVPHIGQWTETDKRDR